MSEHKQQGSKKRDRQYRPTVKDVLSDSLTPIAQQYWAPGQPRLKPYDPAVIEDIYKRELCKFDPTQVTILEFSQYLEK